MIPQSDPIFRFAPSPNGYLHLGHAYSALFTDQAARQLGGKFLLRIEDIDIERSRPAYYDAILEDLAWLGLHWPQPVMCQSERFSAYTAAAERLKTMGLLYPCFCSRADIAANHKVDETDPDGAPLYPGTCRHLSPSEVSARLNADEPSNWRLAIDHALTRTGNLTFTIAQPNSSDRPQIRYARPQRWGDFVVQRKGTSTSYHLSVVVDDAAQNITHITRGRDMEAATDIHVLLQFLLGLPSPIYTHHKLVLDDNGRKLSKSDAAMALREWRDRGRSANDVREYLGFDKI